MGQKFVHRPTQTSPCLDIIYPKEPRVSGGRRKERCETTTDEPTPLFVWRHNVTVSGPDGLPRAFISVYSASLRGFFPRPRKRHWREEREERTFEET